MAIGEWRMANGDWRGVSRVYDMQDAFFLPIAGFRGVQRPGPTVWIFRRLDVR